LDDIMAIKVKFFASLREQQPDGLKEVDANGLSTINDVWERATGTKLMPSHVLCSVNLEHRELHESVKDGDEVAFFPPVTGG
jgi:molybdopterin synthase sulfur carrier subunit